MQRSDFAFNLPPELIAQAPLPERAASRLLCVDKTGRCVDRQFRDLLELLKPGDLLVMNDTRVIPARLLGRKDSGGRVEVLIERVLDDIRVLAQVRASKSPQSGSCLHLEEAITARVLGRVDEFFELAFEVADDENALSLLERYGHMPLPPYIERADAASDRERYQTVYARAPGAVAAPTAGLHFDTALLEALQARGIELAQVTLHVGAGTFQPMRVERLEDHRMHAERAQVSAATCSAIAAARARGGRVVAVGTTAVRSLESAAQSGVLQPFSDETRLFITPGYRFNVVDALITNFHLPESTLIMLVCAFAGYDEVMQAYRHAVEQRYRFFSYGDAMFLERKA